MKLLKSAHFSWSSRNN